MLKLALIENLRRLAEEAGSARAGAPRGRRVRRADRRRRARTAAAAAAGASIRRSSCSCCSACASTVRGSTAVRAAVDAHLAAQRTTVGGGDPRRAPAPGGRAGLGRQRRSPACASCSTLDWSQYFEASSLVEQVLQRDPAGVYGRMDFLSRDRYRQAVEELADADRRGAAPGRPARRRERAPGGRKRRPGRAPAHVGYHLIGKGRARPRGGRRVSSAASRRRARRLVFAHATAVLPRVDRHRDRPAARRWASRMRERQSDSALATRLGGAAPAAAGQRRRHRPSSRRLCARFAAPRRLPRLDFLRRGARGRAHDGRRADAPAERRAGRGAARASRGARARQPRSAHPFRHPERLHRRRRPRDCRQDAAILAAARRGVDALNARYAEGRDDRFFLVPPRAPLESARGRLDGLGAQARQDRGVQPSAARRHGHELRRSRSATPAILPRVRYCITLDSDTRLPRDAAEELIGIIAHPLNRPRFDARVGRVTEGYGILQPRVSVTMASAAGSLFARHLRRAHRRRPVHHRGLGRLPGPLRRGHLHRQGALRRRRLHGRARRPRAGERAAVARPLRRALRAHGARHRRRGRRRLPVERPRARAAPAPLGARRLADPLVAVSVRADPFRPARAIACRSSRAGRSSTTCGAA